MSILVGKKAPDFNVAAILGNGRIAESFTLSETVKGKYGLVFFYPLDFTFVCSSELVALSHRVPELQACNVEMIGASIDPRSIHNTWRNTPVDKGGVGTVKYTLAASTEYKITKTYDVESDGGMVFRDAFLTDKEGVVRSQIVNDLSLGRNMDELLRLVSTLQFHEEHGRICPVNWKKGDKGMTALPEDVAKYLARNTSKL